MRKKDAEAARERMYERVGEFAAALTEGRGAEGVEGGRVTSFSVRLPTEERPETFIVVKASGEDGPKVGFVGALDLATAFLTWRAKDGAGGLRWRDDVPYTQR